jgi:phage terminase small subunit
MKLTAREEKFCQEYVKRLNKTQAAIAAGYSKKTAAQIGYENFIKHDIKDRIAEIQAEIKEKMGIDDHSVLTELASLAFWNAKDFIDGNNAIKDLSKMQKAKLKPVIGLKTTKRTVKVGDETETIVTTEIKLVDKRGALIDLGRHLGIFEEDNLQKQIKIKVTRK